MRWDDLFDDLEGQLEQELSAEDVHVRAEEERLRIGRLGLRDRLAVLARQSTPAGSGGTGAVDTVDVVLTDGSAIALRLTSAGKDWIAGDVVAGSPLRAGAIIPVTAIAAVTMTPAASALSLRAEPSGGPSANLEARLGLPFVLRDLCRRRIAVDLVTSWTRLHGTIDRVGRDHLDLAEHDADAPRRDGAVRRIRSIASAAIVIVRF
jgi:hypothetical protein